MYHSITFGTKNTWTDWGLVPSSAPTVAPPSANIYTSEINGADGYVDNTPDVLWLSDSKCPMIDSFYGPRTGSWDFTVDHRKTWYMPRRVLFSKIANYLHGKRMDIYLEDDPNYRYSGRFTVDECSEEEDFATISIGYWLEPYKTNRTNSNDKKL